MTKRETTIEATTEPAISAANCPEKESHARRLNQTCSACGEHIPGHGYYSSDEFTHFFAPPGYGQPPPKDPVFLTPEMRAIDERIAALWGEHEKLRLAYTAAVFTVEDLQRGRAGARGRNVDGAVGVNFDAQIAAERDRAEKIREGDEAVLREIIKLDQTRKRMHQNALFADSYPPDATAGSIGERIAQLLRGDR